MGISETARKNHEDLFPGHVSTLADTDPELIENFDNFAFDEVLRHGDLDTRTRLMVLIAGQALLTLATLISLGGADPQVKGHVAANLNVGNDRSILLAVITQLLPFVGHPRTLNAIRALNEAAPPDPTQEGVHDMAEWTVEQASRIADPEEVQVVIRRRDGSLRRPTTIWIVGDGDKVFVRSTNGRTAAWFRIAVDTGTGQIISGGQASEVTFTEVTDADLPAVDRAYRRKYGRYAGIVDHLVTAGPRAATLHVRPA